MSGVEIRVRANTSQARRDLSQLEKSVKNIETSATKATSTFKNLALTLGSVFAAGKTVTGINRASDSLVDFENRLALVVGRTKEVGIVLEDLYDVAARSQGRVGSAVEIFNRFGLSLKNTSLNTATFTADLLNITETVQKAVAISGASAESANAAIIQFTQGLASGELRGQELNSVREQLPRLAQAIADYFDVGIGELKKLGEEGALTQQVLFDAVLQSQEKIDKEFENIAFTVTRAAGLVRDEFGRALAELSKRTGFSEAIANALLTLADSINFYRKVIPTRISIMVDEVEYQFARLKDLFKGTAKAIEEFFYKTETVSTPNGTESFTILKSFSELLEDSIPKIKFPEFSYESMKESLEKARQEVTSAIRGFTDAITSIFYETKTVGPGLEELVPRDDNVFGKIADAIERVSAAYANLAEIVKSNFAQLDTTGGVIKTIQNFSIMVGQIFWDLFDYLVGNSVVPDTVDGINESWGGLVFKGIETFIEGVKSRFNSLKLFLSNLLLYKDVKTPGGTERVKTNFFQFVSDAYQDVSPVIDDIKAKFKDLFDFIFFKDSGVYDEFGDMKKVPRKLFESFEGFDLTSKLESIKVQLREFFDYLEFKEVDTPGGSEKVKRKVFIFLDDALERLRNFKIKAVDYFAEIKAAIGNSYLFNEDGSFKGLGQLGLDAITVTQKVFVDLKASASAAIEDLKNITIGFSETASVTGDALLTKINAALFGGTLGLLTLGKKGLLLTIAGLTFASSDIAGSQGFQDSVKRIAKDFVSELNNFLSGPDGNLFANVKLTIGSLGEGVKEGVGITTESDILDIVFGGLTVTALAALISGRFRKALAAAVFFDPSSPEFQKKSKFIGNRLRKLIIAGAAGMGGIYLGSAVTDKLELEEGSWTDLGAEIGIAIAAGFVINKSLNAFTNKLLDIIDILKVDAKLRGGFTKIGTGFATSIAGGIALPVAIGTVAAAFGFLLVKAYTSAANSFMKDSQDVRILIGLNPTIAEGAYGESLQAEITNNLTRIKSITKDGIESGLDQAEIVNKLFEENAFDPVFEGLNKRLGIIFSSGNLKNKLNKVDAIDFTQIFPGYTGPNGEDLNTFIKQNLKDFIENEQLESFDIADYISAEQFTLNPKVSVEEDTSGVVDQAKSLRDDIIKSLDATEVLETFKNSFKALSETPIITEAQQTAVDTMTGSIEGLTSALGDYISKLKEIPNNGFLSINPSSPSTPTSAPTPFATGGKVTGPGTGTSDDVLAFLSNGEFVMKASSVKKYGTSFLSAINQGSFPKFALGGLVGKRIPAFNQAGKGNSKTIEIEDLIQAGALGGASLQRFYELTDTIALAERRLEGLAKDTFTYTTLLSNKTDRELELQDILDSAIIRFERFAAVTEEATQNVKALDPEVLSADDKDFALGQAKAFKDLIKGGLSAFLKSGDLKGSIDAVLDNFTSQVIDTFVNGFVDSIFTSMQGDSKEIPLQGFFEGLLGSGKKSGEKISESFAKGAENTAKATGPDTAFGPFMSGFKDFIIGFKDMFSGIFQNILGLFSGGSQGIGSVFGFVKGLFMNDGGIVPHTPYSRLGVDSVPAMLTPGEMVVPADKVKGFMANRGGSGQTVVNLSITGDVSRQTRQEIVKMLPTIASGVNAQNKERNYKYR